mmetsp:Transcript_69521/g.153740  ORF Transcript_69521/g.153740 Transcript_69521/m.153740 type:complete len:240 (-) Transcript_69521:184-903(-)
MGAASTTTTCTEPPISQEEYRFRQPFALAQAESFESEDCPFCALRRSHSSWLRTEINRLNSEVRCLETTIPPKFIPELEKRLEELPLPDSAYTGGVDEIRGSSCPLCDHHRREVRKLQREARALDSHCKARIEFHRRFSLRIEDLLIEKRQIEAQLFFGKKQGGGVGPDGESALDGHFCAITKVNQPDEDAALGSLLQAVVTNTPNASDGEPSRQPAGSAALPVEEIRQGLGLRIGSGL